MDSHLYVCGLGNLHNHRTGLRHRYQVLARQRNNYRSVGSPPANIGTRTTGVTSLITILGSSAVTALVLFTVQGSANRYITGRYPDAKPKVAHVGRDHGPIIGILLLAVVVLGALSAG